MLKSLIIKVLIVDMGLSGMNTSLLPYVDSYEEATHFHGPAVTSIVLSDTGKDWVCRNVHVDVCNFNGSTLKYYACLRAAIAGKYDYVNLSLSGTSTIPYEADLIEAIRANSIIIVAAGNDHKDIHGVYPAAYLYSSFGNMFVVTNSASSLSNFGPGTVDRMGENIPALNQYNQSIRISGTSFSAARFTHELIQRRCRHDINPDNYFNGVTSAFRPDASAIYRSRGKPRKPWCSR